MAWYSTPSVRYPACLSFQRKLESRVFLATEPGNIESWEGGSILKSHSYLKGEEVSPIYAPIDSTLYQGAYILEQGISQYALFFEISCEMYYIFDHIVDVRDDIKETFPDTPTIKTNTISAKKRIEFKAGDLIGYSIG